MFCAATDAGTEYVVYFLRPADSPLTPWRRSILFVLDQSPDRSRRKVPHRGQLCRRVVAFFQR